MADTSRSFTLFRHADLRVHRPAVSAVADRPVHRPRSSLSLRRAHRDGRCPTRRMRTEGPPRARVRAGRRLDACLHRQGLGHVRCELVLDERASRATTARRDGLPAVRQRVLLQRDDLVRPGGHVRHPHRPARGGRRALRRSSVRRGGQAALEPSRQPAGRERSRSRCACAGARELERRAKEARVVRGEARREAHQRAERASRSRPRAPHGGGAPRRCDRDGQVARTGAEEDRRDHGRCVRPLSWRFSFLEADSPRPQSTLPALSRTTSASTFLVSAGNYGQPRATCRRRRTSRTFSPRRSRRASRRLPRRSRRRPITTSTRTRSTTRTPRSTPSTPTRSRRRAHGPRSRRPSSASSSRTRHTQRTAPPSSGCRRALSSLRGSGRRRPRLF